MVVREDQMKTQRRNLIDGSANANAETADLGMAMLIAESKLSVAEVAL